jgi:DNA-binding XRE family transcriptional regulator
MKTKRKPYTSGDPYIQKMLKDPEVRFFYEEERAKTQLAMAVKTARLNAHLTQAALAKKIGSTQSAIARLESGNDERTPTLPLLAKIAVTCGVKLELGFKYKHAN